MRLGLGLALTDVGFKGGVADGADSGLGEEDDVYITNRTPDNLKYFHDKLNAVMAGGTSPCRISMVGDSLTLGSGGIYQTKSPGNVLAEELTRRGIPARANVFGNSFGTSSGFNTFEPRIAFTGTWATWDAAQGKAVHRCTSASGTMTYTPGYAFDTVDIYWMRQTTALGGGGDMTITIDGGAATFGHASGTAASTLTPTGSVTTATVSQTGAAAVYKTTVLIAGGLTTHTITVTNGASNNIQIWAMEPYTAASPGVLVRCMGASSYTSANISASGTMRNSILQTPSDLWLLNIGSNDMTGSVATATLEANIATLVSNMTANSSDVVHWTFPPLNTSLATEANQIVYNASQKTAAGTSMYVDFYRTWKERGVTPNATPSGTHGWYNDTQHPAVFGNRDIGVSLAKAITWGAY